MSRHPLRDSLDSRAPAIAGEGIAVACIHHQRPRLAKRQGVTTPFHFGRRAFALSGYARDGSVLVQLHISRSEAHPSELQSLMRTSHAALYWTTQHKQPPSI